MQKSTLLNSDKSAIVISIVHEAPSFAFLDVLILVKKKKVP